MSKHLNLDKTTAKNFRGELAKLKHLWATTEFVSWTCLICGRALLLPGLICEGC